MCSNIFSASRGLVGKGLMSRFPSQNLYAIMTLISAALITPISLCVEPPAVIISAVKSCLSAGALIDIADPPPPSLYLSLSLSPLANSCPYTHAGGSSGVAQHSDLYLIGVHSR
eukprot:COSAG05_NODE_77_length_21410_cov_1079.308573_16_plen_114_part_00